MYEHAKSITLAFVCNSCLPIFRNHINRSTCLSNSWPGTALWLPFRRGIMIDVSLGSALGRARTYGMTSGTSKQNGALEEEGPDAILNTGKYLYIHISIYIYFWKLLFSNLLFGSGSIDKSIVLIARGIQASPFPPKKLRIFITIYKNSVTRCKRDYQYHFFNKAKLEGGVKYCIPPIWVCFVSFLLSIKFRDHHIYSSPMGWIQTWILFQTKFLYMIINTMN